MADLHASKADIPKRSDLSEGLNTGFDVDVPELRQLLEAMGEGVYGVDRHGRCTFINRMGVFLLGYEAAANLLGRQMHDLVHHTRPDGSPYPTHDCPMLRTITDGEPVLLDDELLWRRDGTSFPAEYASHPLIVAGTIVASGSNACRFNLG